MRVCVVLKRSLISSSRGFRLNCLTPSVLNHANSPSLWLLCVSACASLSVLSANVLVSLCVYLPEVRPFQFQLYSGNDCD